MEFCGKAENAKSQTIEEEEKEQIKLAYTTVMADKLHKGDSSAITAEELGNALKNQNAEATTVEEDNKIKVTFTKSGNVYTVDVETGNITGTGKSEGETYNTATTVKDAIEQNKPFKERTPITDSASKEVTIPAGFKVAEDSAETIAEGVVIEDTTANKNQFVWVPVDDIVNFVRTAGYFNNNLQSLTTDYTEPFANGYSTETTTEVSEYNAMKQSVQDNHGFYIGRFEAGKDSSENVVIKKGANVYNAPWGNAMNDIEGTTAVKLSKEFASKNGYQGVTSTLCYGVQWDAIMQFMDSRYISETCEASSYVRNNTKKGWYSDNYNKTDSKNTEANPNHITGKDLIYSDKLTEIVNKQKNIYDMAGNVSEWTMEAYSTNNRIYRGGNYSNDGLERSASCRRNYSPDYTYDDIGFRIALYL